MSERKLKVEGREGGREREDDKRRGFGREREVARGGGGEEERMRLDILSFSVSSLFLLRIAEMNANKITIFFKKGRERERETNYLTKLFGGKMDFQFVR